MLSWLQVKKHDERRKARRKTKVYGVSHAGTKQMGKILGGLGETQREAKLLSIMSSYVRRSVFR